MRWVAIDNNRKFISQFFKTKKEALAFVEKTNKNGFFMGANFILLRRW